MDKLLCSLPWTTLQIDKPSGEAACCCLDRAKVSWGNVITDGWEKVWNGDVAQAHRTAMLKGEVDEFCDSNCPLLLAGSGAKTGITGIEYRSEHTCKNAMMVNESIELKQTILKCSPMQINLTLSYLCNQDCIFCGQNHTQTDEIPWEVLMQLEPWLKALEVIGFSGGEPLMSRSFTEFISYLQRQESDKRPLLGLISNGSLFNEKKLIVLNDIGIKYLIISVHAFSKETYEAIHGKDELEIVKNNLLQIRLKLDAKAKIAVAFTITPINIAELVSFTKHWRNEGFWVYLIPEVGGNYDYETRLKLSLELTAALNDISLFEDAVKDCVYGIPASYNYAKQLAK